MHSDHDKVDPLAHAVASAWANWSISAAAVASFAVVGITSAAEH